MSVGRLDDVVRVLERELRLVDEEFVARMVYMRTRDPFKALVATIISQNTTEASTARALRRLSELCEISPEALARVPVEAIAEAIRPAGLQEAKARAIRGVAELVVKEYGGDFFRALEGTVEEVRERLMRVSGIGYKTVDVVLMNLGRPVLAVDTHIARVARRLGLAPASGGYLAVQRALQAELEREDPLKAHLLLIKFGRTICRARRPRCGECPLRGECKYYASQLAKAD
ncbi:MAG: endonuclease III [Thermoprotei archaeon]|nr:MAG: endonuclease III [Thermoprotei archaeon]